MSAEPSQHGKIMPNQDHKDFRDIVVAGGFIDRDPAPGSGAMHDMNNEPHEPIDEILPRPRFAVEATF
ncbi:hypothetical protein RSSM_00969 [Rhodopirellula sallentina SM41]|uniref:Uncharacterized protein n=1 Tax=Rhodopirellula sallentina SM41 TaxID=1263870 RepID=M5UNP2_9BACT|nr:hypothetical protein RSSM_00969 [Rhodopirellula sallentina SM41]